MQRQHRRPDTRCRKVPAQSGGRSQPRDSSRRTRRLSHVTVTVSLCQTLSLSCQTLEEEEEEEDKRRKNSWPRPQDSWPRPTPDPSWVLNPGFECPRADGHRSIERPQRRSAQGGRRFARPSEKRLDGRCLMACFHTTRPRRCCKITNTSTGTVVLL